MERQPILEEEHLLHLKWIYGAALSFIALTLLSTSLMMQYAIHRNGGDARVINLSGRQRMLSQQLTKCVLSLNHEPGVEESRKRIHEIETSFSAWKSAHQGLQHGDENLGLPARKNSSEVTSLFQKLAPFHEAMVQTLDTLLSNAHAGLIPPDVVRRAADVMLENEAQFLTLMDKITFQFDKEAGERIKAMQHLEFLILAVGLFVLLLEFLLIFRPSISKLTAMTACLRRQSNELELMAERNRDILRSAMDGFFLLDERGRMLEVNDACCRITGYDKDDLLTMSISDLETAAAPSTTAAMRNAGKKGEVRFESKYRQKAGNLIHVDVSVQCRYQENTFVVFIRDITERKLAEDKLIRSERLLRETQETASIGYYVTDLSTGRWEASPVMDKLFGIGGEYPHDIPGWGLLIHPEDREAVVAHYHRVATRHELFRKEYRIIRPSDGELRWMDAYGDFEYDENSHPVRLVGCIQDITDRKDAEQKLKLSLQRAEELAEKAESASHAKSDFLAVMSHELRTPLNGVLGYAELLAETPLGPEQMEYARTISRCGVHLLSIINDILDFSSIEKGRLVLESRPVVIAEVVESSCLSVRGVASDKGLEFRSEIAADVPATITGDARRIQQILINLLGNAVKFTANGWVHFRVALAATADRQVLNFSIEDTGIGIDPAMLEFLFEPFTQADSSLHRSFEGTGIGLAISKQLAEAMGGSIQVVSTPHKGSIFTFELPFQRSTARPHGVLDAFGPAVASSPPGRLVLVVEDDPDNSRLAGNMLKSLGYRAEFALNGQQAVHVFVPGRYSAILMDIQLPIMSGIEATRQIRKMESGSRVPIIAITANVMPGDRERCMASGMDDFISKPFRREELAAKLHTLLSRRLVKEL